MNKTKQLVINSLLLALLIVASKIAIPLGNSSFTLQTLVVFVIILLTDWKNTYVILGIYLFLGLVLQLPVFSLGGGLTYIYNPSFGFILGFIVAPVFSKLFMKNVKMKNVYLKSFISLLIALIIIYIVGVLYINLLIDKNTSLINIITIFILPFIIFDIIKCVIGMILYVRLKDII